MKQMKKILSMTLIFAMILCSFEVFAEEEAPTIKTIKYISETELLENIGIINKDLKKDDILSRGEYAKIIYALIGGGQQYVEKKQYFSDISLENESFPAISFVYDMELMSGHDDGTFKPKGNISYNEVISVLVRVLGYKEKASVKGGYPIGYRTIANEIKLNDGFLCDNNDSLRCDEVYKLVFNSLFVAMAEPVTIGDNISYTSKNGKTLLNTYLNMYFCEGIMTDNSLTSLKGESEIKKDAILVDNIVIETDKKDVMDMLGYYVKAYYKIQNDTNILVYISTVENRNSILTIAGNDLKKSTLTQITYKISDETDKTVKVRTDADYIYNKNATGSLTNEQINIKNGNLKLIDYDYDNVYDVLFVNEFQTMIFASCSMDKSIIFGKFQDKIEFKDCEKVFFEKEDKEILISDLKEYDVLAIMKNKKNAFVEVISNVVFGTLDEVKNEKYIVKGKEYYIATEYRESKFKLPQVGKEGTFYLGKDNYIAYFEEASAKKIGIATHLKKNNNAFKTGIPEIKIFTTENEFMTFEIGVKFLLNGMSLKREDIYDKGELFKDGVFIRQVVQYEINDQGEIKSLDFADETKPDLDTLQYASEMRSYKWCNPGTDAIYPTGDILSQDNRALFIIPKTLYFKIPKDIDAQRFYSVSKGTLPYEHNATLNDTYAMFNTYSDKRSAIASIVISEVKTSRMGSWECRSTVVSKISQGVDMDGNNCDILTGFTNGKETKYYATDGTKINGLIPGDIIQLTINQNTIVRYRKTYSAKYNKSCIEYYLEQKANNTMENLKNFYYIENLSEVDNLDYYINKEIVNASTTYSSRSDNSWNTDKGGVYITGTVTYKDSNYLSVIMENNQELQFYLNENEFIYYKTHVYLFQKDNNKVSFIHTSNINLGDKIYLLTEAFSVVDIMVIE